MGVSTSDQTNILSVVERRKCLFFQPFLIFGNVCVWQERCSITRTFVGLLTVDSVLPPQTFERPIELGSARHKEKITLFGSDSVFCWRRSLSVPDGRGFYTYSQRSVAPADAPLSSEGFPIDTTFMSPSPGIYRLFLPDALPSYRQTSLPLQLIQPF